MSQTLLAFMAMMIVTLMSLNQQQSLLHTYESMLDEEMEVMAGSIALQAMEVVMAKEFDNATTSGTVSDPSELTAPPFTTGNGCSLRGLNTLCDDVDDFHMMVPDTLRFTMRNGVTYAFEVSAEVHYVQGSNMDLASTTPTYYKHVTVTVQDVPQTSGWRVMEVPVRLPRVKSCDDACS